jgi:hypothetical protein
MDIKQNYSRHTLWHEKGSSFLSTHLILHPFTSSHLASPSHPSKADTQPMIAVSLVAEAGSRSQRWRWEAMQHGYEYVNTTFSQTIQYVDMFNFFKKNNTVQDIKQTAIFYENPF